MTRGAVSTAGCGAGRAAVLGWLVALAALVALPTAAVADGGDALTGTEGMSIGSATQPVEVATETGFSPVSATIDWGDGTAPTAATIVQRGELTWQVYGYHTYEEENPPALIGPPNTYTTTITVYDFNGIPHTYKGSAAVSDAALNGVPIEGATALLGVATQIHLAHFTDSDPHGMTNDYTAQIDWGDNTGTDASTQIVPVGNGWDVVGTHKYAATQAGGYVATVTISDAFLDYTQQKVNVQVMQNGAASVSATEGVAVSNALVAQFCGVPGNPSATIDWGDGTVASAGTVTASGSCDLISGSHMYAEESPARLQTRVTLGAQTVDGTANVSDAPLAVTMDARTLAGTSKGLTGAVLAHVNDANPGAPACPDRCDLTATVDWGDGSGGGARIQTDPLGGLDVVGDPHTFPGPGGYRVAVTVTDRGGATAAVSGDYKVANPPQRTTGCDSPVPKRDDVAGLYGQPLDPSYQPNWGISPDDRVLRYGPMVICAADASWTYDGISPTLDIIGLGGGLLHAHQAACPPTGCKVLPVAGGVFQTTGRVIVNGLELEPENGKRNTLRVDTSTGAISGSFGAFDAVYNVFVSKPAQVQYPDHGPALGTVNLTRSPWLPSGDTLAYLPALPPYLGDLAGFTQNGQPHVRIDGLGTSATDLYSQMPDFFRTDPTSPYDPVTNPAPTVTTTLTTEYPGEAFGYHPIVHLAGDRTVARAADATGGCPASSGPPPGGFEIPELGIGPLNVGPVDFTYDTAAAEWRGTGCAHPLGDALAVQLSFGIKNSTGFDYAEGDFKANPGIPIGGAVTLNELGLDVGLHPTRFIGHLSGSIAGIVAIDGHYFMIFATPQEPYPVNKDELFGPGNDVLFNDPFFDATAFGGSVGVSFTGALGDLVKVTGGAHALYEAAAADDNRPHPYAEIGVNVHIEPPPWISWLFGADGSVTGAFGSDTCTSRNEPSDCHPGDSAYLIRGEIDASIGNFDDISLIHIGADGVISSYGYALCTGYIPGVGHIGFGVGINGHHTQVFPPFKGSCDTQDWRPNIAAAGTRTVRVPHGASELELQVVGTGAPPAVELTGPHGEHLAMPARPDKQLGSLGALHYLIRPDTHTTYVSVWPVRSGAWKVSALPGSAAISQLYTAFPLPPARVTATVTAGRGRIRLLHYRVLTRPGQTIEFVERGRATAAVIGYATKPTGTIQFSPFGGPAGRRAIYAEVTVNNLPDPELLVTHYTAPPPPRPGKPDVHVARRRSQLLISWSPTADTSRYVVAVVATNGMRTAFRLRGHRLSLAGFATAGALVRVTGVDSNGIPGPPATARLKKVSPPARVRGLTIRRSGNRLIVFWRAVPPAIRYRLVLTVGHGLPTMLSTTGHTVSLKPRNAKLVVTALVSGEGADGTLGPTARAKLPRARG
jgi:hypothetical protein